MSRVDDWWSEKPRRSPAEYACELAEDRFWRDEQRRLIATHPDWPDAAQFLELEDELAHGFVLVLSRLPASRRADFAGTFYAERSRGHAGWVPSDPRVKLALAAAVVLLIIELATPDIRRERIVDLLRGAAQGDDLTRTPEPALTELRKAIARVRLDVELEDPSDPRAAASLAVAEVLDPSSEIVAVQEVVARAAWATVESREPPRVLGFLLEVDRLFADCR